MKILAVIALMGVLVLILRRVWRPSSWKKPQSDFPKQWRTILRTHVSFYARLHKSDQRKFEFKVQEFLLNHQFTGVKTTVDITDKLLVAASAIIPIFSFPQWRYTNLKEVLIYPSAFDDSFQFKENGRRILGMVGTGFMEGKMILSKEALHRGFANESDKRNTAIHEFVHLIDKADGATDGIPELLMERQYAIPWIDLIRKKMEDIYDKESDINPYGGTNKTEFFAVASEYFFERPELLQQKHPELYHMMETFFRQDFELLYTKTVNNTPQRNDPCPCGSGKKYKKCCI